MSAQEYYNSAPSNDLNPPQSQYCGQQQYNGKSPQQQGYNSQQQPNQAPSSQGYDNMQPSANLNGQLQYHQPRDGEGHQSIPFTQQFPPGTTLGPDEANGERGLGATLIGGGVGAFAAKKSGGGLLGAIGGAAAGAIGANMIEHAYKRHERRDHRHGRRRD